MAQLDRRELTAIFLGGMLGTLLRVWLARTFPSGATDWPWAIFAINLSGCFALGCFATHLRERPPQSAFWRPLLNTGLCGAYTTFSTMQLEILRMIDDDRYALASAYALTSVTCGLLAILLATAFVRRVRGRA